MAREKEPTVWTLHGPTARAVTSGLPCPQTDTKGSGMQSVLPIQSLKLLLRPEYL